MLTLALALASALFSLRSRDDGKPVAGEIRLWRIELPAEPGWTAGDEYAGSFQVPEAGLSIPDLKPGRYRAICGAHARSAGELPAFELRAGGEPVVLEVEKPRPREVWVEIFDARGQLFETAEYTPSSRSGSLRTPDWLHPRSKIEADGSLLGQGYGGGYRNSSSDQGVRKLKRGAHGFPLGSEDEDGGLYETTRAITLRVPDHGQVGGSVRFDSHEELRYRALLVEKGSYEGIFTLPDGSPANLGRLHVQTPLEPDLLPRPPEWWLDVPVRIALQAPGCRRLELEHRLRDGLPRPRVLEKAP
jgi:hypothetical protein